MPVPNLDKHFPRYTLYEPHVPVWCLTPHDGRALHRFFDTSPISPSGRYLAVFRFPAEDRLPVMGDMGHICVIDLQTGEDRVVAETRGWEPQLGANINWGGDDQTLFFNDVVPGEWKPFAWKLNPLTGERQRLGGSVYHASPDGRWIVSADPTSMRRTQPGYGVVVPDEIARRNLGIREDDGFILTDTQTGQSRLLVSLRQLVDAGGDALGIEDESRFEFYGFHSKFSPQGDRLIVTMRWFPAALPERFHAMRHAGKELYFAVFTLKLDGSEIRCAVGPKEWVKGGHHINWFPDGTKLSMNLKYHDDGALWLVQCNRDGSELRPLRNDLLGSGHPALHPNGTHLITDTYTDETTSFHDGTIPLRWIDLRNGSVRNVVRINTQQPVPDKVMRVDPHPAWDRTWRYVSFNGFVGGTRRVFVADMQSLLA